MSNQITTQTLSFHGSDLITLKVEDVIYTALRPIVEALGINWATQSRKLENSKGKFNCCHMTTVGADGKIREMLCMPIKKLNGWLFSINPDKVRSDLREKVIQYQEECFQALHDYWTKGIAINERKTTVDDRTGLRDAVNMLVSKKGMLYSDAYNLIHQFMNVQHIDEIPLDKLSTAVAYCHKIVLEGELIESEKKTQLALSDYELEILYNVVFKFTSKAMKFATEVENTHRSLYELLGINICRENQLAAQGYDISKEYRYWITEAQNILAMPVKAIAYR
ncbi:hypothetical protein FHQ28_11700 [Pasteurellaceae bacterium USgator11]|nr:hypothetical protein FHQ20_10955 [Pasteurellaceae bacterium USgator41]TNG92037.1 hypothetical protein FHQ19_12330 [Pasteurellaceae bacterium UScroc12]TNG98824.1 hypothetical protein FHQ28_11700 [Pasteurellaceae bacterium USgator11]TNG99197.1 hypothetical protein FHQ24_06540 [Pasteurellaceae bacterium UScroc31]